MWNEPAAHSDGDVIVFFRKSDVIVAGDIIAADRYPYIDAKNGGSIDGIIRALNRIVGTAVPEYNQQGGTRIVPGHGRIMNQSDVVEYRDMATIIRDRIAAAINACYPSASRRLSEEGRVLVTISIGADGKAGAMSVSQSSGFERLDGAAECVIRRLPFDPGKRDGQPVEAQATLPIVFKLE